jgi:two-component sensor histidine kinase
VVEQRPGGDGGAEVTDRALALRLRQQEILAELGVLALRGTPLPELLQAGARFAAEGLGAEFAKVLEYVPSENRLVMRAGVGWDPALIGTASVGADFESPGGFALHTGKPVISNQLENERRFRTPELLAAHGVRRAINVILQGDGAPYGVLEVDSRSENEFSERDIAFLQGAGNILGMAIERQRMERDLKAALDNHETLLGEVDHRVKNSLQLVASLLRLQANAAEDAEVRRQLLEATSRIAAVARAHRRLYQSRRVQMLDLGAYFTDVCADLGEAVGGCTIEVTAAEGIEIATDRAIPIALILTELITNAAKYAYPGETDGVIRARLARGDNGDILVSVSDDGVGLPAGFDVAVARSLGMRIVGAFAKQLGAELSVRARAPGTEFALTVPLRPRD